MKRFLSDKVKSMAPSALVALTEKGRRMKASGQEVYNFAGGEPDFRAPEPINEAVAKALEAGDTHYVNSAGVAVLKQRIAKKLKEENGIDVNWENQIVVAPGGKMAIFLALSAVLNPGDEVMILEPAWVTYRQLVNWCGAKVVSVPLDYADNYAITEEKLEKYVTSNTRMIIINSPNNPTGRVLTDGEIDAITAFLNRHDILAISDEMYEKIIYDNNCFRSLAAIDSIKDQVITVNGMSKSYAMTGWRLGYIAAHPDLAAAMVKVVQNTYTCAAAFLQTAAAVAFDCEEEVEMMRRSYQERRDFIVSEINKIKGFSCKAPEGAFYIMPKIEIEGMTSQKMAEKLLEECCIVSAPGNVFGDGGEGQLRMCYAASMEDLQKAIAKMKAVFGEKA